MLSDEQFEDRKSTCEIFLQRHDTKPALNLSTMVDDKLIYFQSPKEKKSLVSPGQPSTSTARPNRLSKKTMLGAERCGVPRYLETW